MNTKLHKTAPVTPICYSGRAGLPAAQTVDGVWGCATPGAPRWPGGSCSSARASSTSPIQRSATPGSRTWSSVPVPVWGEFQEYDRNLWSRLEYNVWLCKLQLRLALWNLMWLLLLKPVKLWENLLFHFLYSRYRTSDFAGPDTTSRPVILATI